MTGDRREKQPRRVVLVSSCLIGLCTRYDGTSRPNAACLAELAGTFWIPVCPEQLGGLATPRVAADLLGGNGADVLAAKARVVTQAGEDVTENFVRGAGEVLKIAQAQKAEAIFLKSNSPSCGVNRVLGVTAALLAKHGFVMKEF